MTPVLPDEAERLAELRDYQILDTPAEPEYDDLVFLASQICGTPIALMTLVDPGRQWFKSRVGLAVGETRRDVAFCAHAIAQGNLMVVQDATADARFAENPLVTADPHIRFYAGAPLVTPHGHAMGTLCVIDRVAHKLSDNQQRSLEALSRQAVMLLELRKAQREAERSAREQSALVDRLREEQQRSERLLTSIFPQAVAERLKTAEPPSIAEEFPDVTVLFADLHDFRHRVGSRPPTQIIGLLNRVFSLFDALAAEHGMERIKTIGDAYMAVGGLSCSRVDHPRAAAEMALSMQRRLAALDAGTRTPLSLRIGMNTGPVVAGVVGTSKFAYDLWGPTVNLASQMESFGVPGGIQVTAATYERLKGEYLFEERGEFYVTGEGDVTTYLLKGRRLR